MQPAADAVDRSPTILVVDDEAWNRTLVEAILSDNDYRVIEAENGPEALERVAQELPDLILLDIMMPGIDGLEVLRRVRSQHTQGELPVIMATARAGSDDVVEALDLGANDYVTKPLDFPVVLARVKAQLKTRETAPRSAASAEGGGVSVGEIKIGHVMAGRYRLDERIGSGTFGAVYRAQHLDLQQDVAVKILMPSVTASDEAADRFRREGVTACKLRHPNAVQVTDFGVTDGGVAFMVMELLSGTTLVQELKEWKRLSPRRCLEVLSPVCAVLAEAHGQDLVHRDIKPENIFLHQDGRGETIKLLDFGIAKLVGENVTDKNLTAEGWVLGTPAYMAPERLSNRPYDGRADVYSLGVMLFEMLTGRRPFVPRNDDPMSMILQHVNDAPPTLRSINPGVSADFEPLVARCLAKRPEHRPTAEELTRELASVVEGFEAERQGLRAPTTGDVVTIDPMARTMAIDSGGAPTPAARETTPEPSDLGSDEDLGNAVSRWIRKLRRGLSSDS